MKEHQITLLFTFVIFQKKNIYLPISVGKTRETCVRRDRNSVHDEWIKQWHTAWPKGIPWSDVIPNPKKKSGSQLTLHNVYAMV